MSDAWEKGMIEILSPRGATHLPRVLVERWPQYVIARGELVYVPADDPEDGDWMNPRTFEEWWLPVGLPLPSCQPSLQVLLRDGVPRYMMPALDLPLLHSGEVWRNRGACSLPTARAWLELQGAEFAALRVSVARARGAAEACELLAPPAPEASPGARTQTIPSHHRCVPPCDVCV